MMNLVEHAKKSDCSCGKDHNVPVEKVVIEPGILQRSFHEFFSHFKSCEITVIGDDLTFSLSRELLKSFFSSHNAEVHYHSLGSNITSFNEKVLGKALIGVSQNTQLLVAVGSGTITDCVRYLAYRFNMPFISVPTAPSMDGYASSISPCIIDGFKISLPAGAPIGIMADTGLFSRAPGKMIAAGYGDLIGKYTANMDWLLSSIINGEYFCDYTRMYVLDAVNECLELAGTGIGKDSMHDQGIMNSLMNGLIISGLAIAMIGYSRAASGSEHIISHFLEFKHLIGDYDHFLHGETVSIGTWFMINLYHKIFSMSFSDLENLNYNKDEDHFSNERIEIFKSEYGPHWQPVVLQWEKNRPDLAGREKRIESLRSKWEILQEEVAAALPAPSIISDRFEKVGVIYRPEQFGFSREFLRRAVLCSKEMRDRYTLLTLLDELMILESSIDLIIDTI
jgi:glycerol-1-phosphate dehydrogenase [NAD(P)+]